MDNMRICIWCSRKEPSAIFQTKAHTIPKSLGGVFICKNVCDECNQYFGSKKNGKPSIDGIVKDSFAITRARLRSIDNEAGEVQAVDYKSEFFRLDFKRLKIEPSRGFKRSPHFQRELGVLLRRGIYMIYLEELERQFETAHDPRYDFIRRFVRYGHDDLPVFYFEKRLGAFLIAPGMANQPKLGLTPEMRAGWLINHPAFVEFDFLQHTFGIPISSLYKTYGTEYIKKSAKHKAKLYRRIIQIVNWNDMDLTMSRMDGEGLRSVSNSYDIPQPTSGRIVGVK